VTAVRGVKIQKGHVAGCGTHATAKSFGVPTSKSVKEKGKIKERVGRGDNGEEGIAWGWGMFADRKKQEEIGGLWSRKEEKEERCVPIPG